YQKTGSGPSVHPSAVKVHIGTGDDYPADFTSETGEFSPHQDMTITGLNLAPKKVWVAVPNSMKSKVAGISANDGLPAQWASQRATINVESLKMSNRTGITEITAPIAAGSPETPLAVHFSNESQGGLKFFADAAAMNAFKAKFAVRCFQSVAYVTKGENDYPSLYAWTGKNPAGAD
ncbi:hypothetical protein MHBO_004959, partial [Bonamia ostreae]